MSQENYTDTTAFDQIKSGTKRSQGDDNLENNEALGEDTYIDGDEDDPKSPNSKDPEGSPAKNPLPSSPPHKKTMTNSTTLSRDIESVHGHDGKDIEQIRSDDGRSNEPDSQQYSQTKSNRKLRSVTSLCPNLPDNLKRKKTSINGIPISLHDMKSAPDCERLQV
ncbi:hypothetical protein SARC_03663 [Sphaeroforma arctica JP610]|uniref:Uncharacterized protein n=1 Tax=Sphaeroforma arctica JP610 TaxID=667725 RepID=A0A0L0G7B7_9EUKA|nr:hypothetical protein SARC_03663 [Sphaeroforma arctica JP610]KNC84098.1 hypothetical protein SARC_03663 [Sphaeroforma arctica JP610]|eukprot:XP_014158000.1 hypothetical protein SARC_03663 [Sphaeroforma arctica JP610]